MVLVSASFVVESVVAIAKIMNVAESFIGSTIVALGTSLPEFSIAIQAIRKKHYGIALGDIMGANMSNMTLVLGTAAVIIQYPFCCRFSSPRCFLQLLQMHYCSTWQRQEEKSAGTAARPCS